MRDGFHYKFWVYILSSRTGTLYVGVTGYFDRRFMQHKMNTIEGFTKKYKVHRLVYYETFDHAANAISREKQLKGWRRARKIALLEKINPRWQDLVESWGGEMRFRGQVWVEFPKPAFSGTHRRDPSTPARCVPCSRSLRVTRVGGFRFPMNRVSRKTHNHKGHEGTQRGRYIPRLSSCPLWFNFPVGSCGL